MWNKFSSRTTSLLYFCDISKIILISLRNYKLYHFRRNPYTTQHSHTKVRNEIIKFYNVRKQKLNPLRNGNKKCGIFRIQNQVHFAWGMMKEKGSKYTDRLLLAVLFRICVMIRYGTTSIHYNAKTLSKIIFPCVI